MTTSRQTALITGASAGLGVEFARAAAADGNDVVLVARRKDRLDELAASLASAHGVRVWVVPMDLAQPDAARRIDEWFRSAGLHVDILINNAGFGSHGSFAQSDPDWEVAMVDVNVRAVVALTRLFLPGMVERHHGHILNVASLAGFFPGPWMATYYASKAFVLSFTEALAAELRGTGVTATASCPGPTATEFGSIARSDRTNLFRGSAADAATVARHGYAAMKAGTVVALPGLRAKLTAQSVRFSPRALLRRVVSWINTKRA